ncbi:hypothetical protein NT90_16245 [Acinetobacter baumannii]|nr:hypothetical protein NT90_16245 [Acinetobacter baumannii]
MSNQDPNKKDPDYNHEIYLLLKDKSEFDPTEMNYIFSGIALIFLLFGYWGNNESSPYDISFFMLVTGQIISIILITYNLFEFIPSVKKFLNLRLTKFFFIFSVGSIFLYSRAQVSIELNKIFEIPSDSFIYSLYFGSILVFINNFFSYYFYLILLATVLITLDYFHFSYQGRYIKNIFKRFFNNRLYILIFSSILTYTVFQLKNNDVSLEALPYKLYVISHKLDFDSKNRCDGLYENESVIYLGANKDKVLVSKSIYIPQNNVSLYDFMRDKDKKYLEFNNAFKAGVVKFQVEDCRFKKQNKMLNYKGFEGDY